MGTVPLDRKSGRRDLNPRPSPWQGDALPLSHFRVFVHGLDGAEAQNRTADTAVFSRVLYQLSYLGISLVPFYANPRICQQLFLSN